MCIAINFFTISTLGISLLINITFLPSSIIFLVTLRAKVLLPLPGLPAIIDISPLVIPTIALSIDAIPVCTKFFLANIDSISSSSIPSID